MNKWPPRLHFTAIFFPLLNLFLLSRKWFLRKLVWPKKPKGSTALRLSYYFWSKIWQIFIFTQGGYITIKDFDCWTASFYTGKKPPYINKLWRRIRRKLSKGLLYLFFVYKAFWDSLKIKKQIMIEMSCDP